MCYQQTKDFTQFLVTAVHDIKNTLQLFTSRIEDLMHEELTPHANQQLNALYQDSCQLHASVVKMLTLYRLEHHQLTLTVSEIYLDELIEEQLLQLNFRAEEEGQIRFDCAPDLVSCGDPILLGYILNNALLNALRYRQRRVLIRAYPCSEGHCIEINDDGPGFASEFLQENILCKMPFDGKQTGLGLWLARNIIESHTQGNWQGRIELANGEELGGGIFRLFLP